MKNKQWLEERRTCIGASDAAAILGESEWQSPYSIWANKVHQVDSVEDSERMQWGNILEPIIAERFTIWAEENIPGYGGIWGDGETLYKSKEHDFIGASPDRFVCDNDGNNIGVLEIKTTDGRNAADWKVDPPIAYRIQVQHQLYVMGLQRAWIAVLIGGNHFEVYPVEVNERFQKVLVKQLVNFWKDYVVAKEAPPTDAHKATTEALKLLHPNDSGAELELDDGWLKKIDALDRIKAAVKRLETRRREIENEMKSVIGDATFAHVGEKTISLKTQTRKEHVTKAATFRVLRIGKRKNKQETK